MPKLIISLFALISFSACGSNPPSGTSTTIAAAPASVSTVSSVQTGLFITSAACGSGTIVVGGACVCMSTFDSNGYPTGTQSYVISEAIDTKSNTYTCKCSSNATANKATAVCEKI